jgi:hypothetical protein
MKLAKVSGTMKTNIRKKKTRNNMLETGTKNKNMRLLRAYKFI